MVNKSNIENVSIVNSFGMNKRGQQSMITTVIAIALGVVLLIFLIWGFSSGWNNLWDRIVNVGGGSSNLDTIKQACEMACSARSADGYCYLDRTVKFDGKLLVLKDTDLAGACALKGDANKGSKSCVSTCFNLSISDNTNITKLNFPACPAITC